METTLHQQLKLLYAEDASHTEVKLGRYRIDAIRGDELIEIQYSSLSAIRDKCRELLQHHQLRVVKPIVIRTRITRLASKDGKIVSRRMSPKRGSKLDLFDELIHFTRVFPHPNLVLEVPFLHVEQFRLPTKKRGRGRNRKGYQVLDVKLETVESTLKFCKPADLWELMQSEAGSSTVSEESFNTAELAEMMGRPRWHAQQMAYVLRKTGAIDQAHRDRSGIIYRRAA